MNTAVIVAIPIALIAIFPGWLMSQKAFLISRWRWVTLVMLVLLPFALAYPLFYLSFWISRGQQVEPSQPFIDLLIYAAVPLGLLALVAYVLEHLEESPMRAMFTGAACFALAILPLLFLFLHARLQAELGISIKQ